MATEQAAAPTAEAFAPERFELRSSLREQVTEVLRGAVITGEMRAGELFSAPALAEKFGVSATPVREAMLDLISEGLVEAVRNKGFRVTAPTEKELDDMTALRLLIEVPTCADIARRYLDRSAEWAAEIHELRNLAKDIVIHAENRDLIAYVESDRRFHLGLLRLSGNAEVVAVVGQLRARSRLYGLMPLAERGQLARSAAEHLELLDLVQAGDAAGTDKLLRRHIGHVRGEWAGRRES